MSEKEQVTKEKVESSGIFDFPGIYSLVNTWYKDEGYGVTEEKYSEKVSGNSREIDVEWKATKSLSDYFSVEHKIKFEVRDLTDVEVEIDGNRKKMNKGKITIEIASVLIKDPDGKWESSPSYRFMRDLYNKYVIPARVESMKDKVGGDTRTIKEKVKATLDLTARRK